MPYSRSYPVGRRIVVKSDIVLADRNGSIVIEAGERGVVTSTGREVFIRLETAHAGLHAGLDDNCLYIPPPEWYEGVEEVLPHIAKDRTWALRQVARKVAPVSILATVFMCGALLMQGQKAVEAEGVVFPAKTVTRYISFDGTAVRATLKRKATDKPDEAAIWVVEKIEEVAPEVP